MPKNYPYRHIMQLHFIYFQVFMRFLKIERESDSLISFGREFHCIEALNFTEFKPYLTEFASGKVKRFFLLKAYFVSLVSKRLCINSGDKALRAL